MTYNKYPTVNGDSFLRLVVERAKVACYRFEGAAPQSKASMAILLHVNWYMPKQKLGV